MSVEIIYNEEVTSAGIASLYCFFLEDLNQCCFSAGMGLGVDLSTFFSAKCKGQSPVSSVLLEGP